MRACVRVSAFVLCLDVIGNYRVTGLEVQIKPHLLSLGLLTPPTSLCNSCRGECTHMHTHNRLQCNYAGAGKIDVHNPIQGSVYKTGKTFSTVVHFTMSTLHCLKPWVRVHAHV